MADKSFDAVIIGGGHHGTIIAPYLAKAGLTVGVFERLDHLGGGAVSYDDTPAPGFRSNFCCHSTRFYGHPSYKEFNLRDEGLEYVFPETNEAVAFDDGTSYVASAAFPVVDPNTGETRFNEENVKKTYEQIRQFSKADAESFLDLTEIYKEKIRPLGFRQRYSPPPPWGVPDPLEELMTDPKSFLDPSMQFMTSREIAYYFFESTELRILMLRGFLTSCGLHPEDVPGLAYIIGDLSMVLGWETASIPKGCSQSITDSLVSAGKKLGVEYFINSEVDKVLIENKKAKGIKLLDGTEIGLTAPQGTGTDMGVFIADADPSTTTDPLDDDTDNDGLLDGEEDANHNGEVDDGEKDPNDYDLNPSPGIPILLLFN